MPRKILILLIWVLFVPAAVSAYDLYVQSAKAPVYSMPDMASGTVASYGKGTKLLGLENKGNWHRVKIEDNTGWIYKFLVSDQPPLTTGESSALINQYTYFSNNARRRPSSYTAAAAARGLREKRGDLDEKFVLDYETLATIEAIKITDEELVSFIEQGIEHDKTN